MLIRLVCMTFRPDAVGAFLDRFDHTAPQIRAFAGCTYLELWEDAHFPNVLTTCSHWAGPEALERYRDSSLFRQTWAHVKPLFAARPRAFSYAVLRPAAEAPQLAEESAADASSADASSAVEESGPKAGS